MRDHGRVWQLRHRHHRPDLHDNIVMSAMGETGDTVQFADEERLQAVLRLASPRDWQLRAVVP